MSQIPNLAAARASLQQAIEQANAIVKPIIDAMRETGMLTPAPETAAAPAVDDDLLRDLAHLYWPDIVARTSEAHEAMAVALTSEPMQRLRAAWTAEAEAENVRQAFELVKLRAENASLREQVDGRLRDNDVAAEALKNAWRERDEARATKDLHKERQQELEPALNEACARADALGLLRDVLRAERDEAERSLAEARAELRNRRADFDRGIQEQNELRMRTEATVERLRAVQQQMVNETETHADGNVGDGCWELAERFAGLVAAEAVDHTHDDEEQRAFVSEAVDGGRTVSDEPTAIRSPRGHIGHRDTGERVPRGVRAACGLIPWEFVRVPLSQVAEADRCKTCWPTTKETQ